MNIAKSQFYTATKVSKINCILYYIKEKTNYINYNYKGLSSRSYS